jgi:spermidine synthase
MKPNEKIATTRTPDGGEMVLYRHDRDFSIMINGQDLMHSRQHESELELSRLGCAHLTDHAAPCILIGGLGMGYTLRQALDILSPDAHVVVSELLDAVVEWNRAFFGELNGRPLEDRRVDLQMGDIIDLITSSKRRFDAILLDVDNGPHAMTDSGNHRLYSDEGIGLCRRALRPGGCLAVWSVEPSRRFEQILLRGNLHVRRFRVPAHKGSKSQSRFVWVASGNQDRLPPGGGEPRQALETASKGNRRHFRKRR